MNRNLPLVLCAIVCVAAPSLAPAQTLKGMMLAPRDNGPGDNVVEDIAELRGLGATLGRLQILYRGNTPGQLRETLNYWIGLSNACYQEATKKRDDGAKPMTLVIDFHDGTIGTAGSTIANQQTFKQCWREFARNFRGKPHVWFDLLNEPKSTYFGKKWSDFAKSVASDIRAIDTRATIPIVVAAPSDRLSMLSPQRAWVPPSIPNMIVEAHAWDWHQGDVDTSAASADTVYPYDGPYPYAYPPVGDRDRPNGLRWTRADIKTRVGWAASFGKRYRVPVYIGEVGVMAVNRAGIPNTYAEAFLRDFTRECSTQGVALTIHSFREGQGADRDGNYFIWDYESNPATKGFLQRWLGRGA